MRFCQNSKNSKQKSPKQQESGPATPGPAASNVVSGAEGQLLARVISGFYPFLSKKNKQPSAQFPKVDRPTAKSFLQESALEPEIIRGRAATGSLSSHAALGQIVRRRTFEDTLRPSGGKYPPISALDDPPGMALRFARANGVRWHRWDAEAGPVE